MTCVMFVDFDASPGPCGGKPAGPPAVLVKPGQETTVRQS